jgi:hypothetical protein
MKKKEGFSELSINKGRMAKGRNLNTDGISLTRLVLVMVNISG